MLLPKEEYNDCLHDISLLLIFLMYFVLNSKKKNGKNSKGWQE